MPAARPWLILSLTLGYLAMAHVALVRGSARLAALATATLALLMLASKTGELRFVTIRMD